MKRLLMLLPLTACLSGVPDSEPVGSSSIPIESTPITDDGAPEPGEIVLYKDDDGDDYGTPGCMWEYSFLACTENPMFVDSDSCVVEVGFPGERLREVNTEMGLCSDTYTQNTRVACDVWCADPMGGGGFARGECKTVENGCPGTPYSSAYCRCFSP